jgi:glycerol-3-phosphate acyltransferase PlsY
METWNVADILFITGCYLLGSVTFGAVVARFAGLGNLREQGSGNIGATNVARIGGRKLGAVTLILDALKGFIPVMIAKSYLPYSVALFAGLAVVIGHIFPVFMKFKGGKGVATGIAVLLALYWPTGIFACLIWLVLFYKTRISSLSAIMAFLLAPFFSGLVARESFTLICFTLSALIIVRHRANISRLLEGTEPRISK